MAHLLLIEDDPGIAESTVLGLQQAGHEVEHIADGAFGKVRARIGSHDLVVLDLNLPGADGYEILAALREESQVPVIVVTARTGLDPRLRSFELGADDLLPKPFWVEELVMRVQRRLAEVQANTKVEWGQVCVDLDAHRVSRGSREIAFTPSELALLMHLVQRPNRAVTRAQLLEHALPDETQALERTVDSHLARVRRKLGEDGTAIQTVFRIGYRFVPA